MSFFVDLTLAPYSIVPNDPTTAAQNTSGINAAIAAYDGTSAVLLLPYGDIYCERDTNYWSIRFAPGVSRLTLRGMGMFATTLVQEGVGVADAEWDLLVIDGCNDVEVSQLGLRQGDIENPDYPGDHNALLNIFATTQNCKNLHFDHLYFGPCIGDAFRMVGNGTIGYFVENVTLTNFTMETGGHPRGAGDLGVGSRSGISFQRGFRNVQIGHGFIKGAKNSPFEMEPSGLGIQDNVFIHDVIVDNSAGSTRLAFAIAGSVDDPLTRCTLNNVTVLEGAVQCAHTRDMICSNMHIYTSKMAPAELMNNSLFFMHQDNQGATISNLHLYRDEGSPVGPLVTVIPTGQAVGKITPVAGTGLVDGETFTVSDGVTSKIFEFDLDASVTGGRIPVTFTSLDTATQIRDAIVSAVNGAGINVTASNTPVAHRPAALLTNKHHGKHGNVPITATVTDVLFLVAGMAHGIGGSDGVRFIGGRWISKVTAGSELRYFEARGCDRMSIADVSLELWANLTTEYGFSFRSIGDINSPSISNCRIDSRSATFGATGTKLAAAALFASTNAYQIRDIRVDGLRAANMCTIGVEFNRNGGAGIDAYPLLHNCDFTGATNAWSAINSAAGTVFPVLAGNKGAICTMVGTVAPEGVVTAMQGCEYIRQNGNATTKHFKSTGTGSTGWSTVTIP